VPEFLVASRVAELTRMSVDRPSPVNLAQLPLKSSEAQAHGRSLPVWKYLNGTLINGPRGRQPKVGGSLRYVNGKHLECGMALATVVDES
jgi:hypothetical protein